MRRVFSRRAGLLKLLVRHEHDNMRRTRRHEDRQPSHQTNFGFCSGCLASSKMDRLKKRAPYNRRACQFYSTCQQCRSLIQSDLPRCWTTAKPKFFFGQVVGQDILVKTRQPQPSQKKTLDSALVVLPHPTCARQKKRAPYNRCAFYFIQHVNSVEV